MCGCGSAGVSTAILGVCFHCCSRGAQRSTWEHLSEKARRCPKCIDVEVTAGILDFVASVEADTPGAHIVFEQVIKLLDDISVSSPVASHAVECQHASVQRFVNAQGFGRRRTRATAGEESYLLSMVKEYNHLVDDVEAQTMPSRFVCTWYRITMGACPCKAFRLAAAAQSSTLCNGCSQKASPGVRVECV